MLILFCISLIVGASLYSVFDVSLFNICIISAFYGAFFYLVLRNRRAVLVSIALAGAVVLGAMRFWVIPTYEIPLGNQALTGVVKVVDERLDRTLVSVKIDKQDIDIQTTLYEKTDLLPGDKVSLRGKVELPEDFLTETGRTFDYDQYLASRGVEALMRNAKVVSLEEKDKNIYLQILRASSIARSFIAEKISSYIAFPVDGIVSGMLVGFQGGIPKYLSDIFRYTGTLHTLVLSGYNITVLAGFIGLLFRRVPYKIKTLVIFCGIVSLVLVSGAGVAAVRAGIMGSIALVAGMSLNTYNVFRALLVSFLFFFFLSPQTIFVDPGFHLSFLATFYIIAFLPLLNQKLSFIPVAGKLNLRELLILATGLPVFMLPYLMYFSGLFPLVSPIANIFLVPIIPILMLGGLLAIVTSFVSPLASFIGIITSFVGVISIKVLTYFSTLPQWQTPAVSGWGVTLFYTVFLGLIFRKQIIEHLRNIFPLQPSSHF
ncbi:MAG: ComEC/Rec2 family competence protein [Candidatus Pacebacteria bacterium]|nr:ComEC/Rec2 family competence protein [Candidatus Paceibacterota bacterium]